MAYTWDFRKIIYVILIILGAALFVCSCCVMDSTFEFKIDLAKNVENIESGKNSLSVSTTPATYQLPHTMPNDDHNLINQAYLDRLKKQRDQDKKFQNQVKSQEKSIMMSGLRKQRRENRKLMTSSCIGLLISMIEIVFCLVLLLPYKIAQKIEEISFGLIVFFCLGLIFLLLIAALALNVNSGLRHMPEQMGSNIKMNSKNIEGLKQPYQAIAGNEVSPYEDWNLRMDAFSGIAMINLLILAFYFGYIYNYMVNKYQNEDEDKTSKSKLPSEKASVHTTKFETTDENSKSIGKVENPNAPAASYLQHRNS